MIKLGKIVPLICIIFFVNLYFLQPVFAQIKKSKYLVGSIENFKNNFSQKIIQRKKTGKTFAVGEGKFFIGKIAHQNTNDTSLHVFGSIDSIINASFYLQFNRNKLHGAILLPDQKKAYQYSSDISGQVHVEAASLDKFICTDYILSEGNHIITKPDTNNSAIPLLENSPDAAGCIYLDFDGELIKNSYWDNGRTINAAPSGMSTEDIQKTYQEMEELLSTLEKVYSNLANILK